MELWACSLALYASLGMAQNPAQFGRTCAVCHGGNGEGTDRAPALRNSRELRGASEKDIAALIKNGRGNMPAFTSLPEAQIRELATFVHSMNMDAFEMKPAGDTAAGAGIFFGSGHCSECHTAQGRGGSNGPDLSSIGHQVTLAELEQSLQQPDARIAAGYGIVNVTLRNGRSLRGFARSHGTHDLQLQTLDGRLHLLLEHEYTQVVGGGTLHHACLQRHRRNSIATWWRS